MMQSQEWRITAEDRAKHDAQFYQLKPMAGFITGEQARGFFLQSGLPKNVLGQIWSLADMNSDGKMDKLEFSIAMFLIKRKLQGMELPNSLPPSLKQPPNTGMVGFGGAFTMGGQGVGMSTMTSIAPVQSTMGTAGGTMVTMGGGAMATMGGGAMATMGGGAMATMGGGMQPMVGAVATGPGGFSSTLPARSSPMSLSGMTMGTSAQVIGQPGSGGFQGVQRSATMPHSATAQQVHASPERSASGPEWSIPHGPKLRYKQVFNTNDKTRSGFLTGPQARQILMQTALPQVTLAQIWGLADIDNDGRLTQDEFCVAMHLADMAKAGQALPASLPMHLVPPSFRRGRSGSSASSGSGVGGGGGGGGGVGAGLGVSIGGPAMPAAVPMSTIATSLGSAPPPSLGTMVSMPGAMMVGAPGQPMGPGPSPMVMAMVPSAPPMSPGLPQQQSLDEVMLDEPVGPVSFEDKKKKNFEKGQMELERRRAMLREEQQREKDRQLQLEKQEQEKKERIRMEQERRRQMELDKMLARQREIEAEQEEQRRKMIEQREAARRELERHRQLEIQRQRRQELEAQRIRHQEDVCHLKSKSKTLTCELETLEDKKNSLNKQLSDTKNMVTEHHTGIILMGQTRDSKVAEIERLQKAIQEQRQVKLTLDNQKDEIVDKAKKFGINSDVAENYRIVMNSYRTKKTTVEKLREQLKQHENSMEATLLEVDARNVKMTELKEEIPREQAEFDRLTMLQQQQQRTQQEASTESKRLQQMAAGNEQKMKQLAIEQQRMREENQRKLKEEEERRKQEQVRLAQEKAAQEAERKRKQQETALASAAPVPGPASAPAPAPAPTPAPAPASVPAASTNLFAAFGSGKEDLFSSTSGEFGDFGGDDAYSKPLDPSDPFAAFSGTGSVAQKSSSEKEDPFGAFADFSNAKFDFGPPAAAVTASTATATKAVALPPATAPKPSHQDNGMPSKSPAYKTSGVLFTRYRALFPFAAETPEELSINPGDIIMVGKSENAEPGWLGGELNGKTGWFPENYAEKIEEESEPKASSDMGWASFGQDGAKDPEVTKTDTTSSTQSAPTSSSAFSQPAKTSPFAQVKPSAEQPVPSPTPTPGQGKILPEGIQAEALYDWEAKKENHLSFRPGDIIALKEQQDMWWLGELGGKEGWFPKTQVKQLPEDKPASPAPGSVAAMASLFNNAAATTARSASPAAAPAFPAAVAPAPAARTVMPAAEVPAPAAAEPTQATESAKEYISIFPYTSNEPGDLHFSAGETIQVTKVDGEWLTGSIGDRQGIFPANCVQPKEAGSQQLQQQQQQQQLQQPVAEAPLASASTQPAAAPSVGEEVVTKFPYSSEQPGDLAFEANQTIVVVHKEGDWWTGRLGDREGIFPANYVTPKGGPDRAAVPAAASPAAVPAPVTSPSTPTVAVVSDETAGKTGSLTRKPEIARVIAPYTATSPEQLSLALGQLIGVRKKNPSGWWEGELQARGKKKQIGWFPANYVQIVGSGGPPTDSSAAATIPSPSPGLERAVSPSIATTPDALCQVVSLYPYTKQNEDELSFPKGAVIAVLSKEDKDWWKGELNGATGLFPANYAQELSDTTAPTIKANWTKDLNLLESTAPKERHRQECIHELINTEQSYVDDLVLAIEVIQKPLSESGKLDVQEISRIFVNWREIIQCNNKLLKSLRVRKKMSGENQLIHIIGDVLCEQLPRMTAYIRFCSCQLNASSLLQQRIDNDPEFKDFVKKLSQDPRVKGMPISSYLIKPMQRITRYPLLIKQILKYTAEMHPDYATLNLALEKAEELCQQVNEGVREKENSDKLEWLQVHVDCPGLAEELIFNSLTNCLGPRKYVHSGRLQKTKSNKEIFAFLFNDFLLFTQPSKPGLQPFLASNSKRTVEYRMYRQPLFLNEVDVKEVSEGDFVFNINHIDKVYTLRAESANDRNRWIDKIQAASKNYIETEKKKREKLQRARSMRSKGMGRLLVVIIEGRDLKPSNNITGRADPYCEVRMGSQEHRTRVVLDTLRPVWDASMQFTVKDPEQDVLCITVYDRDLFSPNDFLGRTEVRVADVIKEAKGRGPLNKQLLLHEVSTGEVFVKLDLHLYEQASSTC